MSKGNDDSDLVYSKENFTDLFVNSTYDATRDAFYAELNAVLHSIRTATYGLYSIFMTAGTLINVWFIAAIWTSFKLRARMRNKMLINIATAHLVDCLLTSPMVVGEIYERTHYGIWNCLLWSTADNLALVLEFVSNWCLVILVVLFFADICDFNPTQASTPKSVTVATVVVLALPWTGSILTVPTIMNEYYERSGGFDRYHFCPFATPDARIVFIALDTVVPLSIALILVTMATVCRRRRFSRGVVGGATRTELIGRGREIDSSLFYVVSVGLAICCDIIQAMWYLDDVYTNLTLFSIKLMAVGHLLRDSRVLLLPITWFLLTDIRQRIRTWRPWHRPTPTTELTVTYSTDVQAPRESV